tara:strand:- start:438 stop:695 length:258 start_codon:yes stop_codon:yes gene_type:complete
MSGKGDTDKTFDREEFYKAYDAVFKPKDPFYDDVKKYESRFRGGNTDSTQEETSEDVGANPTSSTIERKPFRAPPIRHGIRRIIE